jgi:RecJ-like exonuclease
MEKPKRKDEREMVTRTVICRHCLGTGEVAGLGVCLICGGRGTKTMIYPKDTICPKDSGSTRKSI